MENRGQDDPRGWGSARLGGVVGQNEPRAERTCQAEQGSTAASPRQRGQQHLTPGRQTPKPGRQLEAAPRPTSKLASPPPDKSASNSILASSRQSSRPAQRQPLRRGRPIGREPLSRLPGRIPSRALPKTSHQFLKRLSVVEPVEFHAVVDAQLVWHLLRTGEQGRDQRGLATTFCNDQVAHFQPLPRPNALRPKEHDASFRTVDGIQDLKWKLRPR